MEIKNVDLGQTKEEQLLAKLDEARELVVKLSEDGNSRVREEYRQILRHLDVLGDEISFAIKLRKMFYSEDVQFVVLEDDHYRPISSVEALMKIEQIDMRKLIRRIY